MNSLDKIYRESSATFEYVDRYFKHLQEVIQAVDSKPIGEFIELVLQCRDNGRSLFFIGNGGSAATASHFANDIAIGTLAEDPPIRALSLTDNSAVMTAIANDFGYDFVFSKQVEKLMKEKDVLVCISASGNSPNILKAAHLAKEKFGASIVSITGFDGGALKALGDIQIHIPTEKGEYGPVEDLHMIVDHISGSYLKRRVQLQAIGKKVVEKSKMPTESLQL